MLLNAVFWVGEFLSLREKEQEEKQIKGDK